MQRKWYTGIERGTSTEAHVHCIFESNMFEVNGGLPKCLARLSGQKREVESVVSTRVWILILGFWVYGSCVIQQVESKRREWQGLLEQRMQLQLEVRDTRIGDANRILESDTQIGYERPIPKSDT